MIEQSLNYFSKHRVGTAGRSGSQGINMIQAAPLSQQRSTCFRACDGIPTVKTREFVHGQVALNPLCNPVVLLRNAEIKNHIKQRVCQSCRQTLRARSFSGSFFPSSDVTNMLTPPTKTSSYPGINPSNRTKCLWVRPHLRPCRHPSGPNRQTKNGQRCLSWKLRRLWETKKPPCLWRQRPRRLQGKPVQPRLIRRGRLAGDSRGASPQTKREGRKRCLRFEV